MLRLRCMGPSPQIFGGFLRNSLLSLVEGLSTACAMPTSCLVVEDASEVISIGEDICLVWEVGTARVDKVNAW